MLVQFGAIWLNEFSPLVYHTLLGFLERTQDSEWKTNNMCDFSLSFTLFAEHNLGELSNRDDVLAGNKPPQTSYNGIPNLVVWALDGRCSHEHNQQFECVPYA